ncbi:MAG TPA: aldo/keto reductase [Vicinamibacteria bacterium]|nr:aldo/keto reductase [Vicinamibacteria bacterium]
MIPQRRFGAGGATISEIGFGCGGYWGLPIFSERKAEALLRHGLERGITFLDTGPNYSRGNAEERLGKLTGGHYRGVLLATKVGSRLLPGGRVIRDFTPEGMEASLRDSLRRLRTDHLDLLQLHGPPLAALEDDRVLRTLDAFVSRGMIKYKGVSADGEVAERAAGLSFFDALMTTYNVVTQESAATIQKAGQSGMAALIKSPLSHHVFGNELYKITRPSKLWYLLRVLKNYRHLLPRGRRLELTVGMPGWTAAEVALKFVLSNPSVSSAVIGTTSLDHLQRDLEVCDREELAELVVSRITAGAGAGP